MTTEIQGRRIPDGEFLQRDDLAPGDYGKVVLDGATRWFNWPPGAPYPGVLRSFEKEGVPFHEVEEHGDGTITVRPSILMRGHQVLKMQAAAGPIYDSFSGWHGFLEQGVWRCADD